MTCLVSVCRSPQTRVLRAPVGIGVAWAFLLVAPAAAQGPSVTVPPDAVPHEYGAERVVGQVEVDGVLHEAVWATADRITLPYETFPGRNAPAPVETVCRVAYDAEALYLGCEAADPRPEAIRAYVSDRDQLDGQDAILLGLAPHDDGRRAFLFSVNPFGVQGDAFYDESRQESDDSWDAIWESAGRLVDDGYTVELAIPFRSLRFPERAGAQSWSFYLERYWPRQANVRVQSFHQDEGEACRLCQVNRLTGLVGITSGGSVQLTPTVSAARVDARPLGESRWNTGELSPEAGLDVAWSLTSDVTLNATLNPDFSQVEADVAQLDANQRFALFFPERRPFFQEGADLFSTPVNLAFTRTIADPDFGGKATGKVDGNAFGLLAARDQVTSILVPGPQGSTAAFLDVPQWTALGVYRRDVTHTSTVGALVTAREGPGYHNRVASVDAFFRPLPAMRVQLQAARSSTDYPDGVPALEGQPRGSFGGTLFLARATFDNRTWFGQAGLQRQGPRFRADAGFQPRADVLQRWAFMSRRWFGTSASWLSELRLAGGGWHGGTVSTGELLNRGVWLNAVVRGPWQSRVFVNPNVSEERFADRAFRLAGANIGAYASPLRWLSGGLDGAVGTTVDYANARKADQVRVQPSITLRPGTRVEGRFSYAFQRLTTTDGRRILDAGVAQARLVYNFSHRAFLRAIIQHRSTDRNPATHRDAVTPLRESALSQLLFSYKVNPQTVLFLGYADNRAGLHPTNEPPVSLTPTGRSFFFKVGYAIQP